MFLKKGEVNSNRVSFISNVKTQFIILPLSIVIGSIVTRMLGPDLKGVQTIVLLIFTVILPVFMFGVAGGIRYYLTNRYTIRESAISIAAITGLYALLNIGVVYLFAHLEWFKIHRLAEHGLLLVVLFGIVFYAFKIILSRIFITQSHFVQLNRLTIAYKFGYAFFAIAAYYFSEDKLRGVVYAMIVSEFIHVFLLSIFILRNNSFEFKVKFDFIKKIQTYGYLVWTSEVLRLSNRRIDQVILAVLLPASTLGYYAIAVTVSELVQIVPSKVVGIFYNMINKNENEEERLSLLSRFHRVAIGTTFLFSIPLVLIGYYLIEFLYGSEFTVSYEMMLYYIPGTIIYMGTRMLLQYFGAIGKPFNQTKIQLAGILIGLPLYFLLIPHYGAIGAAVSSSIAYGISNVFGLYLLNNSKNGNFYFVTKGDLLYIKQKLKLGFNK